MITDKDFSFGYPAPCHNTLIERILCRPYVDYINYIRFKASYEMQMEARGLVNEIVSAGKAEEVLSNINEG